VHAAADLLEREGYAAAGTSIRIKPEKKWRWAYNEPGFSIQREGETGSCISFGIEPRPWTANLNGLYTYRYETRESDIGSRTPPRL